MQTEGHKLHGKHLLAISRRQTDPTLTGRLGLTVTKKIGNSPVRNRVRRMLREWMRLHGWIPAGWDVVLVAKESAARQLHPEDFAPDLSRLLQSFPS